MTICGFFRGGISSSVGTSSSSSSPFGTASSCVKSSPHLVIPLLEWALVLAVPDLYIVFHSVEW